MPEFGTLQPVEIRNGWPSEPMHFTPWLALPENMALLSRELGIEIEAIQTEFGVGNFSLDILARKTGTEESVVIENQFGSTDHKHLGQLLTYAAGVGADGTGARTVVWIAEKFNDQHRAALDWLNKTTEPGIRFFGVELQLWRIGDSPFAPRFSVVSKPNEWQKQVSQDAGSITSTERLYVEFWNAFFEFCDVEHSKLKFSHLPRKVSWLPTETGLSGCGINLNATKKSRKLECHVWIDSVAKGSEYFTFLRNHELVLKQTLGSDLTFDEMPNKSSFKIFQASSGELTDREQWPAIHLWLKQHGEAFHKAFEPLFEKMSF